jgi:hypothetical protein
MPAPEIDQLLRMHPRDLEAAFCDVMLARLGRAPAVMHPAAGPILDGSPSLKHMTMRLGELSAIRSGKPHQLTADPRKNEFMGFTSGELQGVLTNTLRRLVTLAYDAHSEQDRITKSIPVPNFLEVDFPTVDASQELPPVGEHGELTQRYVKAVGGLSARLVSYASNYWFSRNDLVNDDIFLFDSVARQSGGAVGSLHGTLLTSLLESNSELGDGELMFHTDHGNIEATALSAESFGSATGKLRVQPTPAGNIANLKVRFLVVAADLEVAAWKILTDAGLLHQVEVVVLPWAAAGRWYVLADPMVAPVVGRLFLEGAEKKRPLFVGLSKANTRTDSLPMTVTADLAFVPLGRIGIIQGGA